MINKIVIVNAEGGLHLRSKPEINENNIIGIIPNKTVLNVSFTNNDWIVVTCKVNLKELSGWVNAKYLTTLEDYEPEFIIGEPNLYNCANSLAVRLQINDEFGGDKRRWDLQCTEYVQWRLLKNGINIDWPVNYGRNGGRWADIFLKNEVYEVSSVPKIGSAASFQAGSLSGVGHVAYVEDVLGDDLIVITEVNYPNSGKFNRREVDLSLNNLKNRVKFINFNNKG